MHCTTVQYSEPKWYICHIRHMNVFQILLDCTALSITPHARQRQLVLGSDENWIRPSRHGGLQPRLRELFYSGLGHARRHHHRCLSTVLQYLYSPNCNHPTFYSTHGLCSGRSSTKVSSPHMTLFVVHATVIIRICIKSRCYTSPLFGEVDVVHKYW